MFPGNNSRITSANTIILWYFARADSAEGRRKLRLKTSEIFRLGQEGTFLEHVKFEIFGDVIANTEMVRGAIEVGFDLVL